MHIWEATFPSFETPFNSTSKSEKESSRELSAAHPKSVKHLEEAEERAQRPLRNSELGAQIPPSNPKSLLEIDFFWFGGSQKVTEEGCPGSWSIPLSVPPLPANYCCNFAEAQELIVNLSFFVRAVV